MLSSVIVTTRRVTSSQDAASAGRGSGVNVASATANAATESATRQTAHVPAHQDIVGSSAGSHVLQDSTVKTAGTDVDIVKDSSHAR